MYIDYWFYRTIAGSKVKVERSRDTRKGPGGGGGGGGGRYGDRRGGGSDACFSCGRSGHFAKECRSGGGGGGGGRDRDHDSGLVECSSCFKFQTRNRSHNEYDCELTKYDVMSINNLS